jgi:hypothetical protein
MVTLVSFGHSIVCPSSIYRSDYPFGIFWPLHSLSIFNLPFWLPINRRKPTLTYNVIIKRDIIFNFKSKYNWQSHFRHLCTTDKMLFNKVLISSVKGFERWNNILKTIYLNFGTIPTVQYYIVFQLDFGTIPTVQYYIVFLLEFGTIPTVQCYIVFLLDFGTIPTVQNLIEKQYNTALWE